MSRVSRYQWLLIALLSANFGVVFFDRNTISYLASFIQPELKLTNLDIGLIVAAFSFSWAIAGLFMGWLSDRLGKRKMLLVVSTVVFSLASVISGLAGGFVALMGARLLMGVAEGGIMPITQTLIASEVPHERRGLAQGITQNFGANLLANFLGPIVIVAVAVAVGWRNAFYLAALPGFLMAILIALFVREPVVTEKRVPSKASEVLALLGNRTILLCTAISILLVAFLVVFLTFTPLYLLQVRGFTQQHMSWIMSSFGLFSMAVAFIVPGSSDRLGRKPVIIAASLLAVALPLGVLYTSGTSIWPVIACFAFGVSLSGVFPLAMATIPSEVVDAKKTATALSLTMGISEILGGVFAPSIAGGIADRHGLPATLWMLAAIALAICVLALFLTETAPAVLARRR